MINEVIDYKKFYLFKSDMAFGSIQIVYTDPRLDSRFSFLGHG